MNVFDLRPSRGIAIAMTLAAAMACAQDYPAKPVRLVVGFPPGGSNDIVARHLAPKLGEVLGVQTCREPAWRECHHRDRICSEVAARRIHLDISERQPAGDQSIYLCKDPLRHGA